ncbi:hypothetical protein MSG28_008309 [Choristoneura fumiferana]|uniref:Uncharacterized protein n=1 Tax=Choristoneura fumiferana TaxID=7141 RepID=A0ACC0JAX6_CHOFU|nr:hypothetical protein MSG28_008309 [Choristoneura fumiferana]
MKKIYNEYPNEKVVGVFRMTTPNLLVRDLDIVKHIMIKDFDNFADRGVEFSKEGLGKNLFHADGDTWRVLRNRFSPMFTNQKLKNMMHLLNDRADKFTDYVRDITAKNPEQLTHPMVQKYTMSTISACAFGLDIDTFYGEIDTLNRIDKEIFTVNYAVELDMMYPGLLKSLNLSLFPAFVINQRNGQPTSRRDFMDLMLEMRNKQELQAVKRYDTEKERALEITESVIEAQAFLFYAAGYETTASTMGFMLYHLALQTEIQDKLRAEIDEYLQKNNNLITLETVMNDLPYLEKVFDETLRMYPIVDTLQRSALEEYKLPGTNVKVAKNQMVLIPALAIHHDEKYYPNPSKFDPDRFSPENVAARHPCAYLPFGVGPRHCIGMRFAQVQSRICVIRLLSKFRLEPSKNTVRSFQFDPYRGVLSPKGGLQIIFIIVPSFLVTTITKYFATMDFATAIAAIAALIGALYYYFTRTFNYWKDRNVPYLKPVPFFGNLYKSTIRSTLVGEIMKKIYNEYPNEKVVGVFRMTTPNLLVRDLDIVKHIMIKDFDNFADRGVEFSKEGLGKNLFHADGDTWRVLRNRFSPMFTNQKLKNMMHLLNDRADKFTDYVRDITAKNPEQLIHPLVQKYTMSTISACAFGLDIDTFYGEIETLKRIDKDMFTANYALELDMMYPGLLKSLNLSIFPAFVINQRNGQPTSRRDFMDLMLEMRNKQELQAIKRFDTEKERALEITQSVIEAQAFLFYAAGYETSASTMGFMLYQLALETEIQDKLRAEIDEYLQKNNNQITLETVMNDLPYLEKVFDETLRMYPIVDTLQRCALEEYKLPGTNVKVAKNQMVLIPALAIHHDEKYYPNPSKFDPDRFSPENVAARHPCAYLPFGVGPRHCIDSVFYINVNLVIFIYTKNDQQFIAKSYGRFSYSALSACALAFFTTGVQNCLMSYVLPAANGFGLNLWIPALLLRMQGQECKQALPQNAKLFSASNTTWNDLGNHSVVAEVVECSGEIGDDIFTSGLIVGACCVLGNAACALLCRGGARGVRYSAAACAFACALACAVLAACACACANSSRLAVAAAAALTAASLNGNVLLIRLLLHALPPKLSGLGVCWGAWWGRAGGVASNLAVGVLLDFSCPAPFISVAVLLAISIVAIMMIKMEEQKEDETTEPESAEKNTGLDRYISTHM